MNKITTAVIKYFSEMNIDMLSTILDDNKTYQDATKEVFLARVETLFQKFKNAGDTFLKVYDGNCCSNACPNSGYPGFNLVGNKSLNSTTFVYEEDADDLKDLLICYEFKIRGKEILTNKFLSFSFFKDEEAAFKPSVEYLILFQRAEIAVEEIISLEENFLSTDDIIHWQNKHFELYEDILEGIQDAIYKKAVYFTNLYFFIIRLMKYLNLTKKIKIQNTTYKNSNQITYTNDLVLTVHGFELDIYEIKKNPINGLEYIKINNDYGIFILLNDINKGTKIKRLIDMFRNIQYK